VDGTNLGSFPMAGFDQVPWPESVLFTDGKKRFVSRGFGGNNFLLPNWLYRNFSLFRKSRPHLTNRHTRCKSKSFRTCRLERELQMV